MVTQTRLRRYTGSALVYITLALAVLIFVGPVLWMVSASLMPRTAITAPPVKLLPPVWQPQNYIQLFSGFNFARYMLNSIIVSGSIVLLNLFFCALTGYSLAKFRYPGKKLIFSFILATLMVPFNVILIPLYLIIRQLNWIDTYQALIIPFAMTPFGIFLMRQFIVSIPSDYIDAARIDGASEFGIFFRIILPLARPALVTLAILTFVTSWDEFLWPLVVTSSNDLRTLPIGLAKFLDQYENQWNLLMAGSVVAALPVVLLFLAFQRPFLQNMGGVSGLKG